MTPDSSPTPGNAARERTACDEAPSAHAAPDTSAPAHAGSTSPFPPDFLWGASSSAFQVEGGWDEGGKGPSIADVNSFARASRQATTKVASDFYHRWREDIDLMAELGLKAYRMSVAWSRVIPSGDGAVSEEGLAFYDQVIDRLLSRGIQPLVTLYHFDLPYELQQRYGGWADRRCALAFERFARVCFERFGDRVGIWQTINEQNLMVRVDERMGIATDDPLEADRLRAQMDYHMLLGNALATAACHELVRGGKVGPAISSSCTYPLTTRPEDVWAARMNDYLKSVYCLDAYWYGEYGALYRRYLEERGIVPVSFRGDAELLAQGRFDYLAVNYYRTLCASHLPASAEHPAGSRAYRGNEVDFDQYGWCRDERNECLEASEYGAQIDPTGLRIVLGDYWARYHVPMIVTENGLGAPDEVSDDGQVHDPYRIDYLRAHVRACADAIGDGVGLFGYSPWSFTDLLSSHQGFRKRYGFVYVNRDEHDLRDMRRIPKDSYRWYQQVIRSNGRDLG